MNYLKSLFLSAILMLAGASSMTGQTVSPDDAKTKAMAFMKKSGKMKAASTNAQSLSLAYTSQKDGETYYYVFNNGRNGFVIVSGDEVAQEILGYSCEGSFDYDQLPDNMKWFLSYYDLQISSAIKQVKEGKVSAEEVLREKRTPRKSKAAINYLMQTQWDQVAPYNSQIPLYSQGFTGTNALATGCVATAGAQIMKYHNWPDSGVGSNTLGTTYNGLTFSADFGSTTYDWTNMQNTYTPYDTYTGSAADIAVGTLMYHVGVAVDMQYGQIHSGGSGAVARKLAEALVENFKYSKGITYHSRAYYTDEQWEDMVYNELAAGRPVLYGGQQEDESGHSFVCDGYDDGLYHINWGWSGHCDGNFLLTPTATSGAPLCPDGSGSGGGTAGEGYYVNQEIAIGISPDRDGTSTPVKSAYTEFTLATTSVAPGGNIVLNGYYCWNASVVEQSYNLKMKFTNTADPSDVTIGSYIRTTSSISSGYGISSNNPFTAPFSLVSGQSYYVTLMYENSNGEYVDMPQLQTIKPQVVNITAPEGLLLSKDVAITDNGYITAVHGNISFSVRNYNAESVTQNLIVWVFPGGGGNSLGYWHLPDETFTAGQEKDYVLTYTAFVGGNPLVAGTDYLIRVDNNTDQLDLSPTLPLHFRADKPVSYTLTAAGWGTLCLPYSAEVPDGLTAYTVTETDGNLLVKEEADKLEMNKPYLVTGTPGTYPFNGPDTPETENLKNGLLIGNTTAAQTYAPQGSYVLQNLPAQSGLAFYEVANAGEQRVRQYGAYLKAEHGLTSFFTFNDDEAAGISTVEQQHETPAYNLNGVRVNSNAKGLVIVNGKLYFNK